MNKQITDKIDEIFAKHTNSDMQSLKNDVKFDCKKLYNQMMQSGFSEYIAVAECLDYVSKIQGIIDSENDINTIKELLNSERTLKDNIKNTTSEKELSDNYDSESINKIIKLVEDAAKDTENLSSTDIQEQNDDIVYKNENSKKEETKSDIKPTNKHKKYFTRLLSFLGVISIAIIVIVLIHLFV